MQRLTLNALNVFAAAAALVTIGTSGANLRAQTTTNWTNAVDGRWDDPANWNNGVAEGTTTTANFNTLDIVEQPSPFFRVGVGMETNHTVNQMVFGDTGAGTPGAWELYNFAGTPVLTLGGTTPSITVNPLGTIAQTPPALPIDDAIIRIPVAGTVGFTKLGNGVLTLAGTNTITGPINVNAGTLRFTGGAIPVTATVNLADGTTLESSINLNGATNRIFTVPVGATANISIIGNSEMGRFDARGANLNVNFPAKATFPATFNPSGNWLALSPAVPGGPTAGNDPTFGPATVTINSQGPAPVTAGVLTGAAFRITPNRGTGRDFNAGNTFTNTPIVANNTMIAARTNSGGNTISIGSLAGDATSILSGGDQGTVATYSIGSLNTSTTFAGAIDTSSSHLLEGAAPGAVLTGGLSLTKVGTGTLTLSGPGTAVPTTNANASLRGGIYTVSTGTLKLSGGGTIGGGVNDATLGDLLTTIRILSGAVLDVSATTGTYSTAALQQVIGNGAITGNYNHDEGFLAPGDALNGTNPIPVATVGTLAFTGNLGFGGSGGTIRYDVTPSTATADLINVTGVTNLSGTPTLRVGFLGGFTTGQYTVLSSSAGFGGSDPTGWIVDWPARGTAPTLQISGNNLILNVTQPPTGAVTWSGAASGVWSPGASGPINWFNTATNVADRYFDLDAATFADTANGSPVTTSTVTLNTTVTPLSVTVNNSTVAYTISGTGKITGSTTFTKTGSNTLTLSTANDFTGAASIQAGTVNVGTALGALGTGALTISGGSTLISANTTNGGAFTNSSLTIGAGANVLEINGLVNNSTVLPGLAGSGNATITTTVVPVDPNLPKIVTISGNNLSYSGTLTVGGTGQNILLRTNSGNSALPLATVSLGVGATLRDSATSVQTIRLGALTGPAGSFLGGGTGGSGATNKTWQIGELNSSTSFDGNILNGTGSGVTRALTGIIKAGTGTLTLTAANNYGGTTTVNGGTLLVNGTHVRDTDVNQPAAGPFVVGDYIVNSGGTLGGTGNIGDSTDTDPVLITVNSGGRLAPGASVGTLTVTDGDVTFGPGGIFAVELNSAGQADLLALAGVAAQSGNITFDPSSVFSLSTIGTAPAGDYIIATYTGTRTGTIGLDFNYNLDYNTPGQVILHFAGLITPGDFAPRNGQVTGGDLATWAGAASNSAAGDADGDGDSDGGDFLLWQSNFGAGVPATPNANTVPEPAAAALWALGLVGLAAVRRRAAR